jgi:prepilin peptidase CpaA
MDKYLQLGAVIMASIAAVTDLRRRRIPNLLTYTGLLLAVTGRSIFWGWPGLKSGLIGALVAGGVFCLLFLFGAMGGGDVKLMGAVGAWVGASDAALTLIAVSVAGGFIAFAYLLFGFGKSLRANISVAGSAGSPLSAASAFTGTNGSATRVPFGLAIAIGTFVCAGNAFLRR